MILPDIYESICKIISILYCLRCKFSIGVCLLKMLCYVEKQEWYFAEDRLRNDIEIILTQISERKQEKWTISCLMPGCVLTSKTGFQIQRGTEI